ncbi:MAG: hypothetical protein R3B81_00715 [bacterium]
MRFPASRAVLLLALLVAAPVRADVLLNEFGRTGAGASTVELYNALPDTVDLTGWFLRNQDGLEVALSGSIAPGEHQTTSTGNLVVEGGQIELYDGTLLQRDEVSFGDQGGAPLPPPGAFSCARSPDGTDTDDDAADWNLDSTPTFGATNDHLPANLGFSNVAINEVGRSAFAFGRLACPTPRIELHNKGVTPVNLNGWFLTDGRQVVPLSGPLPANGFVVVTDFPPLFCFEETHVLYLFGPAGRRFDQVGVLGSSLPPGSLEDSWQRVPDGSGPYDGYDYATSGGSVTWVIRTSTFGQPNGSGPITDAPELDTETWGRLKAGYRVR